MELEDMFDDAKEIEVYEDSSFLVTHDGKVYSWGRNEHGFLGREAKLDVKTLSTGDKKKKLAFSTFVPGKIEKLERYFVSKLVVKEGKVMTFFADGMEQAEEGDGNKE